MNMHLTDGQTNAFTFAYFGMAIDILSTGYHTIVLNINREANPIFNWITPAPVMTLSLTLISVLSLIVLLGALTKFNSVTNNRYELYPIILLYSLGIWRIYGAYTWLIF